MAYVKPKSFRISGAVPVEINEQVDIYAAKAGMTKGQFVSLCVQLGLQAWRRIYEPEKLLDAETWDRIIKSQSAGENEKK